MRFFSVFIQSQRLKLLAGVFAGLFVATGFIALSAPTLQPAAQAPIQPLTRTAYAVQPHLDIAYGDQPKETLDVFQPKNTATPLPVIFWTHGGAFIAGDKAGKRSYLSMLARNGFIVVNVNYSLAPKSHYPAPLHDLANAYRYIVAHHKEYNADMNRVIFGGDSAGAQIALQFTNLQVNSPYSKKLSLSPIVPATTIQGTVSLSGLLDMKRFAHTTSKRTNKTYKHAGKAYFDDAHWQKSIAAKQASIVGNTSANFPATFITDGNTNSFEDQAHDLVDELQSHHVTVISKFYSTQTTTLHHEYQFDMSKPESQEIFDLLVDFLHRQTKNNAAKTLPFHLSQPTTN